MDQHHVLGRGDLALIDAKPLASHDPLRLRNPLGFFYFGHGDKRVATLERKHILSWRDKIKDKPGAANKMIRVVKLLLSFAIDRGIRADNPALRIKMFKLGEFRDWTDEELVQFEERWPLGTMERTGYAMGLYTLQRRADVAAAKWTAIAGDTIMVRQSKTGTALALPVHPALAEALQAVHPRRDTIIAGNMGHELNPIYFGKLMADAIAAAGLPDDCVLHGLRKSGARILEELGQKVRSMSGHLSPQMERHYSKRADQSRNAKAAVLARAKRDKNKTGKLQTAKSRVTNLRKNPGAP
jgi:enterobacteria phage integrase